MKKIYQIVFVFSVLFFVGGEKVVAQSAPYAKVKIRCASSTIDVNARPLFIIDGVPQLENALTTISPEDIEAITVLKDAAATAIYSSRGQNGVILITLKKKEVKETKVEKVVAKEVSINIFPNPTSESVNIALHLKEKSEVEIIMYNLQTLESHKVSKKVYEAGEQKINWNVESLKNGTYNIKIKIGNQIIDRKIIIQ
jgi:TonB-dependent SusC/RagA subfamily outer membrane receptor